MKSSITKINVVIGFFLTIIVLLQVSNIYMLSDSYYIKAFEKYNIAQTTNLTQEELTTVRTHIIDFLSGKKETFELELSTQGETYQAFNEKEILHMDDVRRLVEFFNGLRYLLLAIVLAIIFFKRNKELIYSLLFMSIFGILEIFLALPFIVFNFRDSFIVFHEILFTNDLWLLDPSKDLLIQLLPQGFFMDIALNIFIVFSVVQILIAVIFIMLKDKIRSWCC